MNPVILRFFTCVAFLAPISAQSTPSTPYCFGDGSGAACPCANTGPAGTGCGNSYGGIIQLTSSGIAGASVATDTLTLIVDSPTASPFSYAFFFQGTAQAGGGLGTPFGDGLLCVDGTITRLGVVFAYSTPTATYPGGITPAPIHLAGVTSPGDVRHYQALYRDPTAFCSSAPNNTTSALTLVWGS